MLAHTTDDDSNMAESTKRKKAKPTWIDVKAKVAAFDKAGLLHLVSELYSFHQDNQSFLHTRFGPGAGCLWQTRCQNFSGHCKESPLGIPQGNRRPVGCFGASLVLVRNSSPVFDGIWVCGYRIF